MLKKYLKSVLFWLIFFPLLYALSGFIILPWWIRTQLPSLLHEKVGLNVEIEEARFNPFSFELSLNNVALFDDQKQKVIGVQHAYLNYETSALFKKEFLFKNVLLDQPFVDLSLDQTGGLKLLTLFSHQGTTQETNTSEPGNSLVMPFVIEHIAIQNGQTHFADPRSGDFQFDIGPISYSGDNLSFYKDDLSVHALKALLQNEEKLSIATSLSIEPLKLYGELTLKQLDLAPFWHYFLPTMPATLTQGELSLHLPFWIDLSKDVPLVTIDHGSVLLEHVAFEDPDRHSFVKLPSVALETIDFDLQKSHIDITKATMLQPEIALTLEKDYATNVERLFTPPPSKQAPTPKEQPSTQVASSAWTFALKTLDIQNAALRVEDQNVKSKPILVSPLSLNLSNVTSDTNQSIAFILSSTIEQHAKLALQGQFTPKTNNLVSDITAQSLPLTYAQPYLAPWINLSIKEGSLSAKAKLQASFGTNPQLNVSGDAIVDKLTLLDRFKHSIVAWNKLNVNTVHYSQNPASLQIETIVLDKPYVNLDIQKNRSTNFSDLLKTPSVKPSSTITIKHTISKSKATKKEPPMSFYIGRIDLKNGSAHFKDASLPIPFATLIHRLNGQFTTLNTKSTKPSVLKMEGKVDKYGYAKIDGSLLPFDVKNHANLKILFKNINMPSLTPYSGKFVGYAIKEGKLSMDLKYQIKKGLMEGQNKINIDSLTLGDKIDSKDAVSLPLELAIAILKDANGQIDIDLPVSGDLNDPEFRYGSIVWKAIGNLLTSVVTSPFKLLGSMLGIETERLKSIDFAPGTAALIDSEEEKMVQYQQILEKRAGLKLTITPSYNEALDMQALKEDNVTARIEKMLPAKSQEDVYAKTVKKLFIDKFGSGEYDKAMKQYQAEQLDLASINEHLIEQLAKDVVIPPETLQALAQKRADTIIQTMVAKYHIAPDRLNKQETKESDAIRETWVGCIVSVTTE